MNGLREVSRTRLPPGKLRSRGWKTHWPRFRDARTEGEWHDAKADQDHGNKKIMFYDALKLPLTTAEREQLQGELRRPGPASHWLVTLLERKR